jgi:hypothetical protein
MLLTLDNMTLDDTPDDRTHLVLYASVRPGLAARRPQLMGLSQNSLVVRGHRLPSPGQGVRVTIHFLDSGRDVEIEATVVQVDQDLGEMVLRFVTVEEGGPEAITRYIDHLSVGHPPG